MWLCFSYVLVHNNKCVEQTVLAQTYTNNSAAKKSHSGGGRGQGFRISRLVVCIAFTFFCLCSFKTSNICQEKHTLRKRLPTSTNNIQFMGVLLTSTQQFCS